jgi:hypothetical protein
MQFDERASTKEKLWKANIVGARPGRSPSTAAPKQQRFVKVIALQPNHPRLLAN